MAETGGGVAVLSSLLSVAFDTVTNRKRKEYKEFLEDRNFDLIQNLKTEMISFSLFVDAAEKKQFGNEDVRKWLLELKDATYKAEDVLDGIQIEYEARQSKAVTEDQEGSSSSQDPLKQEIEPKLHEILDRLKDLRRESDAFGLSKAVGDAAAPPRSFEFVFDVFLNFRGDDVRYGFLHYLREALEKERIEVFYDAEDLGKGEEIDNILKKIEVSKMSIMIFSKDYASSSYCLEELVKIFECKKTWRHEALPVFYHVAPEVVASQSGIYGKAFRRHERKGTDSQKMRTWRASLAEAAGLSGHVLENKRPETDDIRDIVEAVKKILEGFVSEKGSSEGRKRSYSEFCGMKRCMEERSSEMRETTSMVDKSEGFYGRDADKKAIIDMLISDDDNRSNPGVIPVVGMGGVGKTTLAQHIFNDKAVEEQFMVRKWVCVSDQFDVTNVTRNIVEKVTGKTCPHDGLDELQRKLNDALDGNKFLLVLDDVWSEDREKWLQLLTPLRSGAKGSKLIITTRSKDVASTVQTVLPCYLRELEDEDCWKLFASHAWLDVNSAGNRPVLEAIGKEIVRKCGGLPLAAKALGGVLRWEIKAEKWKELLKSEVWDLQNANILPALRMSYIHLPSHLKRCFAYCAIFPQDYKFEKEEVVALWMAEGFLVPQKGKKSLEEIGDMYFDRLVSRSFFQLDSNRGKPCFVMHDLVHDLARFVSGEFCSRLEWGTSSKIGERTRHLSYGGIEKDRLGIRETPFLRSFVPAREWSYLNKEFIDGLLRTQKLLRVLSLPVVGITVIPNSIGNLKHMRHLNLSGTSISLLPEAVTDLFNLEILILRNCIDLVELPADMARLINLCQLDLSGTYRLVGMPPEMGKLKKLSKLSDFIVGQNGGSSIKELGNLHNLRGEICIRGLQNVKDDWDASEAILKDKENLKLLELEWDWRAGSRQAKQVLERLQPHVDIESIEIRRYGGREFPNWVGGISFSKLKELHLFELMNCIRLPPLWQWQLESLEKLSICGGEPPQYYCGDDDVHEVLEAIGPEFFGICKPGEKPFASLKTLKFRRMKIWREWSSCNGAFPVLEELELRECPQLLSVCHHLPSLKRLRIENCLMVKCISLETFPNLEELDIFYCFNLESLVGSTAATTATATPEIESFPEGAWLHLPNLIRLCIRSCGQLESLGLAAATTRTSDPLFSLSRTSLPIEGVSELVSFPAGELHAPNLKRMKIEDCGNLKSMHALFPSLEELELIDCPKLLCVPTHLPNLKRLLINGSSQLDFKNLLISACGTLETIDISRNAKVKRIPVKTFPNLKELTICHCYRLESLGSTTTTTRRTSDPLFTPSKLVSFPRGGLHAPNLKSMIIQNCGILNSLPQGMHFLCSLEQLTIRCCPSLESFPDGGLPSSLFRLHIFYCPSLKQKCEREIGEDWPKIKHIPDLFIN